MISTANQKEEYNMAGFINRAIYRDKVSGCWTGKNIGGTLGAPFEHTHEMLDLTGYAENPNGSPEPNDDLDLQLVWLRAVEEHGVYQIDERLLGEYWLAHVTGPWSEYGICKFNMVNGLPPPLSGMANNGQWRNSNGAWIRSEIWACLFPGVPSEALRFAWSDACVDHADEGICAELFTAALESAAFIESDMEKLVRIGLAHIPAECRVAECVRMVVEACREKKDWRELRNELLEANRDLGWFQAPCNIGFMVLGLLYGEGDFGRSVCLAVNCGDDTDCTGATCGAILGIVLGRSGIPEEWTAPIGESIKYVAVNPYELDLPPTLDALTDRVLFCKYETDCANPALLRLTDGASIIPTEFLRNLLEPAEKIADTLHRSSRQLMLPLPYGELIVEYGASPVTSPGERQVMRISFFCNNRFECRVLHLDWRLPESWSVTPGAQQMLMTKSYEYFTVEMELTAGHFSDNVVHIPIEVRISDRNYPVYVTVPFQLKGSAGTEFPVPDCKKREIVERRMDRRRLFAADHPGTQGERA